MNINLNNYESFLLMYVDEELTASERLVVEQFVEENPNLREELQSLQAAVLSTDPDPMLQMPGKAALLRPELWDADHLSAAQEKLLLYADGALPETDKVKLDEKIKSDKLLRREVDLLNAVTLNADEHKVTMPAKELLYRHETARVISMVWVRRLAAAAVIAGLGWFIFSSIARQDNPGQPAELVQQPTEKTIQNKQQPLLAEQETGANNQHENVVAEANTMPRPLHVKEAESTQASYAVDTKQPKVQENFLAENLEIEQKQAVLIAAITETPVSNNGLRPQVNTREIDAISIDQANANAMAATNDNTQIFQQALYREDNAADFEEESIYVAGARFNKQKVRNVFRSVTRTVGRTFERNTIAIAKAETEYNK